MSIPEFSQVNITAAGATKCSISTLDDINILEAAASSLQSVFLGSGSWPLGLVEATQPVPIFLPKSRIDELRSLSESLHIAVCDIIERWWSDADARFWERMPIDRKAEAVLRWVSKEKNKGVHYARTSGFWRPDVLISTKSEHCQDDTWSDDNSYGPFKICEINCRYPLSGYLVASTLDKYYVGKLDKVSGFDTTVMEVDTIIRKKFEPYPIVWFLHGEGIYHIDLVNMRDHFEKHDLNQVRFVRPEHLAVKPDQSRPSGFKLIANRSSSDLLHQEETDQEMEIDIVVIEARQAQLVALPLDILKQLALRAINDFRSIFFAHDKRMLGLVLQELENLTNHRGVLSAEQSACLRNGLAETYMPRSIEMAKLLKDIRTGVTSKDELVLKPIASGKGKGIIFGTDVQNEHQFYELLRSNEQTGANVLQRVVAQPRFKMVAAKEKCHESSERFDKDSNDESLRYLVGTFMISDGQFLGTLWRASPQPICAFSQGAWLLNAVTESFGLKNP